MADLSSPETWADSGANAAVNAARLTNHVNGATILPAFISGKSTVSPASGDTAIFFQASSGNLVKATLSSILGLVSLPAVDPVAGTAGSRTLGTGAQQAAPGNDTRFPASVTGIRKGAGAGSTDAAAVAADLVFAPLSPVNGGGVALSCAVYDKFTVNLTNNTTITFSNIANGATILVQTIQDATGGRTLAWATTQTLIWPSSTPIAVSAAANAKDLWEFKRLDGFIFADQRPSFG